MILTPSSRLVCICVVAVLARAGQAQAQQFAHNRLEFSNRILTDREDIFPNQARQRGPDPGDGLFKVLPAQILERQGDHRISGYRMAIAVQRAYASFFPAQVKVPGIQVFRTQIKKLGGPILGVKEYETLDPQEPVTGTFDLIRLDLPDRGAYTVEVKMDPMATDPKLRKLVSVPALVNGQRAGLAILALANSGESSQWTATSTSVMRPSYQERHIRPGRDSYSGGYAKRTDTIEMYGMLGQPSPRGELYLSLLFDNPTLTMLGTASGGLQTHKAETGMGPGAFDVDITTTVREVGFFAHAEQYHVKSGPPFAMVPMIVSFSPSGPTSSRSIGNAQLRISSSSLDLGVLFQVGAWGFLGEYVAGTGAGFVRDKIGAWNSLRFLQRPNPTWIGQTFWVQGVVVDVWGEFPGYDECGSGDGQLAEPGSGRPT